MKKYDYSKYTIEGYTAPFWGNSRMGNETVLFFEDEGARRFARKLRGMGVEDELERLGAERGDDVQILDFVFTFKE